MHEKRLLDQMEEVTQKLRALFQDVRDADANVAPHWDDDMKRDYQPQYAPAEEALERFLNDTGPRYTAYLQKSVEHLETYAGRR